MNAEKDQALQAIADARALLDTLLSSGWQDMHVVSGGTEIFLARNGGGANPMRAAALHVAAPDTLATGPETAVKAPHVATLVDVLAVGTRVEAGQKVATLHVLDAEQAVEAPVSGIVVRLDAAAGDLLDYGAALLQIAETA